MCPILFVHNERQRFVAIDLELIKECWPVQERYERHYFLNPIGILRAVWNTQMVFCWFASWHSLLPVFFARLLNKPSLVVIGGYDTANVAEAGYGSQRGGVRGWISRTVIKMATHLLTNSESARKEAIVNARADPKKITVVYHGIEPLAMGPMQGRERIVLTIGQAWKENLLRKGLLPFVETAKYLPDVQFIHIGKWCDNSIDQLRATAGDNVQFKGFVSDQEMLTICQQASVYVQASLHEGFGMSLAEAMSAGCIPVVTSAGAIPEVVGHTGIYVHSNAPADLALAIQEAFERDGIHRQSVRDRIVTEFSIERRRKALHTLVKQILKEC